MKKILLVIGVLIFIALAIFAAYVYLILTPNPIQKTALGDFKTRLCGNLGGVMRTAGCGIAGCSDKCVFPYRDGGKPCRSSADCSGLCVVTNPNIVPPVKDTAIPELKSCIKNGKNDYDCSGMSFVTECQKEPLANCGIAVEFNDGKIHFVSSKNCSI